MFEEIALEVDINQSALKQIQQSFDNGLPVIMEIPEFPNRLVKIHATGLIEELAINEQGDLIVTQVLDENFQRINEELASYE